MKIEGVLTDGNYIGANRYSLLVSNVLSYDFNIPAGAKVTVEWDENVHRCEEMERTRCGSENLTLRRDSDGRWHKLYVWNIKYCPYCGEKLETTINNNALYETVKTDIVRVGTVTTKPNGEVLIEGWEFDGSHVGQVIGCSCDDNDMVGGWTVDELRHIAGGEKL